MTSGASYFSGVSWVDNDVPHFGRGSESAELLRQRAFHARILARTVLGEKASRLLNDCADDLESQARALDRVRA